VISTARVIRLVQKRCEVQKNEQSCQCVERERTRTSREKHEIPTIISDSNGKEHFILKLLNFCPFQPRHLKISFSLSSKHDSLPE
jgi:hypothetical protein